MKKIIISVILILVSVTSLFAIDSKVYDYPIYFSDGTDMVVYCKDWIKSLDGTKAIKDFDITTLMEYSMLYNFSFSTVYTFKKAYNSIPSMKFEVTEDVMNENQYNFKFTRSVYADELGIPVDIVGVFKVRIDSEKIILLSSSVSAGMFGIDFNMSDSTDNYYICRSYLIMFLNETAFKNCINSNI